MSSKVTNSGRKLNISEETRACLEEMLRLSFDERGNEIFVGLSHVESALYVYYRNPYNRSEESSQLIFREFYQRHEHARLQRLAAVIEARTSQKH
jgi:hypothetical protein